MDITTYKRLRSLAGRKQLGYWYRRSEQVFTNHDIRDENDLIKLVAFAYSWMPTIPTICRKIKNWEPFELEVKKLRSNDLEVRKSLISKLMPAANNSIVGASKILYFLSPSNAPVIDRNVVIAWRKLLYNNNIRNIEKKSTIAPIPANFGSISKKLSKKRHIDLYIAYWDNLINWANNCGNNVSMRDIEKRLYLYGKFLKSKS